MVFPQARAIPPPRGKGFPPSRPHLPKHARQVERLSSQIDQLQQEFAKYKATVSGSVASLEPEMVLVIRIVDSVGKFKQAVDNTDGLEWFGESDTEDIEPDDDFYHPPTIGINFFKNKIDGISTREQSKEIKEALFACGYIDEKGKIISESEPQLTLPELAHIEEDIIKVINDSRKAKDLSGRLFLSMVNEQGMKELLNLWEKWKSNKILPHGKTKWRDVFNQIIEVRRWGITETLRETRMTDYWKDLVDPIKPDQTIHCQIELFYANNKEKRKQNEEALIKLAHNNEGNITKFLDMPDIAFHAAKASFPSHQVQQFLESLELPDSENNIEFLKFAGIMYFRPTGQSLVVSRDEEGTDEAVEIPPSQPELPPVAAILDGAPSLQHKVLVDYLLLDDPDELSAEYQPGKRKHGTAMASLVVHGELAVGQNNSLKRKVHHVVVMQPNPQAQNEEHIPNEVFFEDRIERAVLRMIEGEGDIPAQAPDVKIINLSIGDPTRPFIHTPSPWARLLDWLSWKHRVLFCVSAGNCVDNINIGIPNATFMAMTDNEKINHTLKSIAGQLSSRRLLSPAESLNALTIGALHTDSSGDYDQRHTVDLLPDTTLFSPISRLGHGFRRSVKPEILFSGGRQLYSDSPTNGNYRLDSALLKPGQRVASDSSQEGETSECVYTQGTSNATALATRGGAQIYEVLSELQEEYGDQINDGLIAVLIKALLVHGAKHSGQAKSHLENALKNSNNSRRFKEIITRYMGYGAVDIDRVLACTEQRATVLGCSEIHENEMHEYRFPLPVALSERNEWRRMVVTLAWFSPINPRHRNLREAKLGLSPSDLWDKVPLRITRQDSNHNQVLRGTVQHEVLEGKRQIEAFQDNDEIVLQVICKKDATEALDETIPYGLAVTLEVEQSVDIPIYEQIRAKIAQPVTVGATEENI